MTIDPQTLSIAGFSIILVSALVQFGKQAIELVLNPVSQKGAHDLAIQALSLMLGVASVFVLSTAFSPSAAITSKSIATDVLIGVATGFAASGQYSVLTALKGLAGSGASVVDLAPAAADPAPATLLPGIGVVVGTAPAPETPAAT